MVAITRSLGSPRRGGWEVPVFFFFFFLYCVSTAAIVAFLGERRCVRVRREEVDSA